MTRPSNARCHNRTVLTPDETVGFGDPCSRPAKPPSTLFRPLAKSVSMSR